MRENILILSILIACAFSGGAMVAGGLLPPGALYAAIGAVVLIAVALIFVGGLLGVVYLFKRADRPTEYRDLYRAYPSLGDRPTAGRNERPAIEIDSMGQIEEGHHRELLPTRRETSWKNGR